jgi:glycosyltransferase involved in cell wall biosynthesis
MKVLLVHNFYRHPGGEDRVFAQERQLLEHHGHQVVTYQRSNSETLDYSTIAKLGLPAKMYWASDAHQHITKLLREEKPRVVHVHNTFFQISPAIFAACQEAGIPVVQTLHNFRLMCPAATYFRDGKICERCSESGLLQGIWHGCYRESRGATTAVAFMLAMHRWAKTWIEKVNLHIALTQFSRSKFTEGGLPPDRIVVKPNFVAPDPGEKTSAGEGAVFVGRFWPEKGVATLLRAWAKLGGAIPLKILGDGPLSGQLRQMVVDHAISNVTFLGHVGNEDTRAAIKNARMLILPSENYENFPVTIVEALSCGTPVICSRLGAMQEIVTDRATGLHFTPGNPDDLAEKVAWAWDHPGEIKAMGRAARREYEQKYTAESNYSALMSIYDQAISASR